MELDFKGLAVVGEGHHGKVYRLDQDHCVKVYKKQKFLNMEYAILKRAQEFPFFPKVVECKDNCMIREFFIGPSLWDYLQGHAMSEKIALQLLEIIDCFIELGFSKVDCHLHHIIVTQEENLKVIDPTTLMSKRGLIPDKMLSSLEQLGCKKDFLEYTKVYRPQYYSLWSKF